MFSNILRISVQKLRTPFPHKNFHVFSGQPHTEVPVLRTRSVTNPPRHNEEVYTKPCRGKHLDMRPQSGQHERNLFTTTVA